MSETLKCPVCRKPLTQAEYDKALGLWKHKQEHIEHLEEQSRKLKQKELAIKQQAKKQEAKFKARETKLRQDKREIIAREKKRTDERLRQQKATLEGSFERRVKTEVKKGVREGTEQQRKNLQKQENDLRKTKNKMAQLEKSLGVWTKKCEEANDEIKRLKEQIKQGITPQIEGLLEEGKLLAKLTELFPHDKFEHPGKGGDIIQAVTEQGNEIGRIVYECKRVKQFDKKHIDQAKDARRFRKADFGVLVTNAFPAKRQYYFVEKTVFVISPVCLEPIVLTLRESLVRMSLLRMTNEAKEKAVQKIYSYLSSSEYNVKVNEIGIQLLDLGKELKSEISSHKRTWIKRYSAYRILFADAGEIDYTLKELASNSNGKPKLLSPPKRPFIQIGELDALEKG